MTLIALVDPPNVRDIGIIILAATPEGPHNGQENCHLRFPAEVQSIGENTGTKMEMV